MKILHRYVLKEHVGPVTFAISALTSMLLLNYVAKRFGELAGKGLPWSVIGEFVGLTVPFIFAMTLPMAVLISTLYAFSRLAADNEITALKSSGVGLGRVMTPVIVAAVLVTLGMIWFNDQVMPRANHRLAVLHRDIAQKKPTFALREQVINELSPGKFYLRAGHIDPNSNRMREITIYDFGDVGRRRTIHADSGDMAMTRDRSDLLMTLYDGTLQDVPVADPTQLQRLFFKVDLVRVRGVGNQFSESEGGTYKGEREMTVCEMEQSRRAAQRNYTTAQAEFAGLVREAKAAKVQLSREVLATSQDPPGEWSFSGAYCVLLGFLGAGGTDSAAVPGASAAATARAGRPPPPSAGLASSTSETPDAGLPKPERAVPRGSPATAPVDAAVAGAMPALVEASRIRMLEAGRLMNLLSVEIHKKFALAVACLVFVLLGAPIALRFPRGGVGLTIGVSIAVFGLYYVALIGGQSLGNRGIVPPALAMWGANMLFGAAGVILLFKLGTESATSRGGDAREMADAVRAWIARHVARLGLRLERRRAAP
ncbi:MAG TPA: LptF/LptG family permease [Gemmatimonadaceae bacterium]|nr:LptF/LptG family permease [Gemmatimonadaceae bacterium]